VSFVFPARLTGAIAALALSACATREATPGARAPIEPPIAAIPPAAPAPRAPAPQEACRSAPPLRVTFYDAGQALAALVSLPDGRHVLVDTGESPKRPACAPCDAWHARVMAGLTRDLGAAALDMLWVTHQHSDHLGGVADVLATFRTHLYVDNGEDTGEPGVKAARAAATAHGVRVAVVSPSAPEAPLSASDTVRFSAILPQKWPRSCRASPNDCSIVLRVDHCATSLLFTGDAEAPLEAQLSPGPVTVLQVGHHGSDTSTTDAFLAKVRPTYAVISSGRPDEGTNATYCHPRASTVARLTRATGGNPGGVVRAFDGRVKCKGSDPASWHDEPTSDHVWVTARDGDVTLESTGDGTVRRVPSARAPSVAALRAR
jgi:competence protein ComEC